MAEMDPTPLFAGSAAVGAFSAVGQQINRSNQLITANQTTANNLTDTNAVYQYSVDLGNSITGEITNQMTFYDSSMGKLSFCVPKLMWPDPLSDSGEPIARSIDPLDFSDYPKLLLDAREFCDASVFNVGTSFLYENSTGPVADQDAGSNAYTNCATMTNGQDPISNNNLGANNLSFINSLNSIQKMAIQGNPSGSSPSYCESYNKTFNFQAFHEDLNAHIQNGGTVCNYDGNFNSPYFNTVRGMLCTPHLTPMALVTDECFADDGVTPIAAPTKNVFCQNVADTSTIADPKWTYTGIPFFNNPGAIAVDPDDGTLTVNGEKYIPGHYDANLGSSDAVLVTAAGWSEQYNRENVIFPCEGLSLFGELNIANLANGEIIFDQTQTKDSVAYLNADGGESMTTIVDCPGTAVHVAGQWSSSISQGQASQTGTTDAPQSCTPSPDSSESNGVYVWPYISGEARENIKCNGVPKFKLYIDPFYVPKPARDKKLDMNSASVIDWKRKLESSEAILNLFNIYSSEMGSVLGSDMGGLSSSDVSGWMYFTELTESVIGATKDQLKLENQISYFNNLNRLFFGTRFSTQQGSGENVVAITDDTQSSTSQPMYVNPLRQPLLWTWMLDLSPLHGGTSNMGVWTCTQWSGSPQAWHIKTVGEVVFPNQPCDSNGNECAGEVDTGSTSNQSAIDNFELAMVSNQLVTSSIYEPGIFFDSGSNGVYGGDSGRTEELFTISPQLINLPLAIGFYAFYQTYLELVFNNYDPTFSGYWTAFFSGSEGLGDGVVGNIIPVVSQEIDHVGETKNKLNQLYFAIQKGTKHYGDSINRFLRLNYDPSTPDLICRIQTTRGSCNKTNIELLKKNDSGIPLERLRDGGEGEINCLSELGHLLCPKRIWYGSNLPSAVQVPEPTTGQLVLYKLNPNVSDDNITISPDDATITIDGTAYTYDQARRELLDGPPINRKNGLNIASRYCIKNAIKNKPSARDGYLYSVSNLCYGEMYEIFCRNNVILDDMYDHVKDQHPCQDKIIETRDQDFVDLWATDVEVINIKNEAYDETEGRDVTSYMDTVNLLPEWSHSRFKAAGADDNNTDVTDRAGTIVPSPADLLDFSANSTWGNPRFVKEGDQMGELAPVASLGSIWDVIMGFRRLVNNNGLMSTSGQDYDSCVALNPKVFTNENATDDTISLDSNITRFGYSSVYNDNVSNAVKNYLSPVGDGDSSQVRFVPPTNSKINTYVNIVKNINPNSTNADDQIMMSYNFMALIKDFPFISRLTNPIGEIGESCVNDSTGNIYKQAASDPKANGFTDLTFVRPGTGVPPPSNFAIYDATGSTEVPLFDPTLTVNDINVFKLARISYTTQINPLLYYTAGMVVTDDITNNDFNGMPAGSAFPYGEGPYLIDGDPNSSRTGPKTEKSQNFKQNLLAPYEGYGGNPEDNDVLWIGKYGDNWPNRTNPDIPVNAYGAYMTKQQNAWAGVMGESPDNVGVGQTVNTGQGWKRRLRSYGNASYCNPVRIRPKNTNPGNEVDSEALLTPNEIVQGETALRGGGTDDGQIYAGDRDRFTLSGWWGWDYSTSVEAQTMYSDPTCPYRGIYLNEILSENTEEVNVPSNPFLSATIGLQASLPQPSNFYHSAYSKTHTTATGLMLGNEMRNLTAFYRDCGLFTHMSGLLLTAFFGGNEMGNASYKELFKPKNGSETNIARAEAVRRWDWDYNAYLQHVILKGNPSGTFPHYPADMPAGSGEGNYGDGTEQAKIQAERVNNYKRDLANIYFMKDILNFVPNIYTVDGWKTMWWNIKEVGKDAVDTSWQVNAPFGQGGSWSPYFRGNHGNIQAGEVQDASIGTNTNPETTEDMYNYHNAGVPNLDTGGDTGMAAGYPNMDFTVQPVVSEKVDASPGFPHTQDALSTYGIDGGDDMLKSILAIRHIELSPFVPDLESANKYGWSLTGTFLPGMCICFDDHVDETVIPYPEEMNPSFQDGSPQLIVKRKYGNLEGEYGNVGMQERKFGPWANEQIGAGTGAAFFGDNGFGSDGAMPASLAQDAVRGQYPQLNDSNKEAEGAPGFSVQYPMHHHMYFINPNKLNFNVTNTDTDTTSGSVEAPQIKVMCLMARIRWATMRNTAFTLMETAAWGGIEGYKPVDWFDCNYKYQARGTDNNLDETNGSLTVTQIEDLEGPPVIPNMYGYGAIYGAPESGEDGPLRGNGQVPQLVQNNAGYFTNVSSDNAGGRCGGGQGSAGLQTFDDNPYDPYRERNTSPHSFCVQSVQFNGGANGHQMSSINSRSSVYFNYLSASRIQRYSQEMADSTDWLPEGVLDIEGNFGSLGSSRDQWPDAKNGYGMLAGNPNSIRSFFTNESRQAIGDTGKKWWDSKQAENPGGGMPITNTTQGGVGSMWYTPNHSVAPYQLEKTYYSRGLSLFKNNANLPLRINFTAKNQKDPNYWGWTRTSFMGQTPVNAGGGIHFWRGNDSYGGSGANFVLDFPDSDKTKPSESGDGIINPGFTSGGWMGSENLGVPGAFGIAHDDNWVARDTLAFPSWQDLMSQAENNYNFNYGHEQAIGMGLSHTDFGQNITPTRASYALGDGSITTGGQGDSNNPNNSDTNGSTQTAPAGNGTTVGLSPTHNIIQNILDYNPYCQGEYVGEGIWRRVVYYDEASDSNGRMWQYYNTGIRPDGSVDVNIPLGGMWGELPGSDYIDNAEAGGCQFTTSRKADDAIPILFPWIATNEEGDPIDNLYTTVRLYPSILSDELRLDKDDGKGGEGKISSALDGTFGNYLAISSDPADTNFLENRSMNAARCYRINAEMLYSQTWSNNYWGGVDGENSTNPDDCALRGLCPDVDTHQLGSQVRCFPNMPLADSAEVGTIPDNAKINISCWAINDDKELNFGLPMGLLSGEPNSKKSGVGGHSTCAPNSGTDEIATHYKNNGAIFDGSNNPVVTGTWIPWETGWSDVGGSMGATNSTMAGQCDAGGICAPEDWGQKVNTPPGNPQGQADSTGTCGPFGVCNPYLGNAMINQDSINNLFTLY